jgi:hypothetical protein
MKKQDPNNSIRIGAITFFFTAWRRIPIIVEFEKRWENLLVPMER